MQQVTTATGNRTFRNPQIKDVATFLITAAESGGRQTLVEVELAPKGGNGMHLHRSYDEHFEVLEGELGLQVGNRKLILKPGETATAFRGQPHRFFNPSESATVRFRVALEPGSAGFENAIKIAYGMAEDGSSNGFSLLSISALSVILFQSDSAMCDPIGRTLLQPLMRWIYRRAQRKGIEAQLLEKYGRTF